MDYGLIIAIAGRLIISLALVVVGYMAIRYGYKLFIAGVGLHEENGKLKIRGPKVNIEFVSSSVGGLLMLTSIGWASATYFSLPRYASNNGNVEVASFDTVIKTLPQSQMAGLDKSGHKVIIDFASIAKRKIAKNPTSRVMVWAPIDSNQKDMKISEITQALNKAGIDSKYIAVADESKKWEQLFAATGVWKAINPSDVALVLTPGRT